MFKKTQAEDKSNVQSDFNPLLRLMRVNFQNETNWMHQFALNERILKAIQKEISYKVQELKDCEALTYVYYFLLPIS